MESFFQFKNPVLKEIEFKINDGFVNNVSNEVKITANMSVRINRQAVINEAVVDLAVKIGAERDDVPYYIYVVEGANFKWKEGLGEDQINSLLNVNAPTLLLSYLRPIVSQITSASMYGAYNIPFMNFVD